MFVFCGLILYLLLFSGFALIVVCVVVCCCLMCVCFVLVVPVCVLFYVSLET